MKEEDIIDSPEPRSLDQDVHTPMRSFAKGNERLKLFYYVYACLFIYLLVGMGWRQLVQNQEYERRGEQQSMRRVLQPGPRGYIYDRNGKLLVGTRPKRSAVVYLDELRTEFREAYYDRVREAKRLNDEREEQGLDRLNINRYALHTQSREEVLQKYLDVINGIIGREETVDLKDMKRHFYQRLLLPLPLIEDLTPREYAQLTEQLPVNSPIQIYTDSARYYPYREAACHVLGYVGRSDAVADERERDEDEDALSLTTYAMQGQKGRSGLELEFNERLSGTIGEKVWRVDPVGYQYGEPVKQVSSERGHAVVTSLDVELQKVAESSLGSLKGAVVALDIPTGEVLVMASKPNYDLNDLSPYIPQTVWDRVEEQEGWLNRAVQGWYQPGSTFKVITAIAAMRHAGIDPGQAIECGPFYEIGNWRAPEHGGNRFGWVDVPIMLQKSSNVYCYQVALKTGVDKLAEEAKRFGLGSKTGIELPVESAGLVPTKAWKKERFYEDWRPGDTANMSIGQGSMLATPLQMACLTASLARRETRTKPTLLHVPGRNPRTIDHGGESIGLTDYEYDKIIEGMEMAANPGGTARRVKLDDVRVAAKTGTAQHRSHGRELTLAWTIAFAPIENPRIAIAVMVEGASPYDNFHGGSTAGPIARAVLERYFQTY